MPLMMKPTILLTATLGLLAAAGPTRALAAETPALTTDKEKFSYALGMYYGNMFVDRGFDLNIDILAQAIKDTLATNRTMLTSTQMDQVLREEERRWNERQQAKLKQQREANLKKAEAFLAENKSKPGVMTTPSGLQYKILTEGNGPIPSSNDTVTVNYRGTLLDGTEFDNSAKRGAPATFPVTGVIKGWTEALEKMKVGSKWQLFIPPNLAYGEPGRGSIPPNSLLIFDVELLTNAPPQPPPASSTAPLTSDIIKVPSLDEMKKGAKIETLKPEDVEKEIQKGKQQQKQETGKQP